MNLQYSLVTTVFNDNEEIIELIKEMEHQTLAPQEFLIADGGSKDGTPDKIREYALKSPLNIKVLQKGRLNIAQGFNYAIKNSSCDYIGIVACGNHYPVNFFELLLEDIQNNSEIVSAYSGVRGVGNTNFSEIYTKLLMGGKKFTEKFPTNHGNLTCKKVFEEEGYFYEKFQYAGEDREFFLRIINSNYSVYADERLEIQWQVPSTFQEFIKQQNGYIVSDMEMYDNNVFLRVFWGRIRYIFILVCMIIFLFIPITRIGGMCFLVYLLYRNLKNIFRYGIEYAGLYNIFHLLTGYVIFKNMKFLLKKNKIEHPLRDYT